MDDNKIFDEDFVFDEEIDFDGLDSDDTDSMIDSKADEVEINFEIENEVDEVTDSDVSSVNESFDYDENDEIDELDSEKEDETALSQTKEPFVESVASQSASIEKNEPIQIEYDYNDIHVDDIVDNSEIHNQINTQNSNIVINRLCIVNTAVSVLTLCAVAAGIAIGYNYINSVEDDLAIKTAEIAELEEKNSILEEEYLQAVNLFKEKENETYLQNDEVDPEKGKILFYDTSVGYSWTPILEGIKRNDYKKENFSIDNRNRISYTESGEASSYFGIDVSSYQGDIDWQLVKEDNVEFAFLRIGYRGYGEEGKICPDETFVYNYDAAHDAGIDLGVYFFSQAISVEEAVEEANYVLSLLEGRTLEYPIVFDWETVQTGDPEDIPRTEDVKPQTLTLSAIAFCETIKDAGYEAMIYTNKKLATIKYDLRQLQDYPIWLAYYDTELNYCYDFDIWQYGTGQVDGITGEVDVNIAMIK